MLDFVLSFYAWLPPILQVIVLGVFSLFIVWSVLKVIAVVKDLIPFL